MNGGVTTLCGKELMTENGRMRQYNINIKCTGTERVTQWYAALSIWEYSIVLVSKFHAVTELRRSGS
jgi:hypothetical protein